MPPPSSRVQIAGDGQVDGDDVRAPLEQRDERTHLRARPEHDDGHVTQVEPAGVRPSPRGRRPRTRARPSRRRAIGRAGPARSSPTSRPPRYGTDRTSGPGRRAPDTVTVPRAPAARGVAPASSPTDRQREVLAGPAEAEPLVHRGQAGGADRRGRARAEQGQPSHLAERPQVAGAPLAGPEHAPGQVGRDGADGVRHHGPAVAEVERTPPSPAGRPPRRRASGSAAVCCVGDRAIARPAAAPGVPAGTCGGTEPAAPAAVPLPRDGTELGPAGAGGTAAG